MQTRPQLRILTLMLLLLGCSPSDSVNTPQQFALDCSLVVVNSDYMSSNISLLNMDGSLCRESLIHSGSADPGLAAALSGDTVLATEPSPDGLVVLVDRYPNGTLTYLDPANGNVIRQINVSTGFAANPKDVLHWTSEKAYVTRAERNPTPTPESEDFDEGADILIIQPTSGDIVQRIALDAEETSIEGESLTPRPGQMARVGDQFWVVLANLSADFTRAGPGLVYRIDPNTDTVAQRIAFPALANCLGLRVTPDGDGLWGVCTGVFASQDQSQTSRSGIFYLGTLNPEPVEQWSITADLLANRPLAFDIAPIDSHRAVVVSLGQLNPTPLPDQLLLIDRSTETAMDLGIYSAAYQLGGLAWSSESEVLFVADGDVQRPTLLRVDPTASQNFLGRTVSNPSIGLPPRSLAILK